VNTLITGVSGCLGRHLLQYLQQHQPTLQCHGVARRCAQNHHLHACDLADAYRVDELIAALRPQRVFHLAGSFSNDFDTDFKSNVLNTRNLLDAIAAHAPLARVVLIGSAAEYGHIAHDENPVAETHPLRPISVYGWSKAAQTHLASLYHSSHGMKVMVARLFNLLGDGISTRLFIGNVQQQIAELHAGKRQTISVGNLDGQRDYIDVAAACEQLNLIASRGEGGEVYNVASGKPVSMRQVLHALLAQANIDISRVIENGHGKHTPHAQVDCIYANISRMHALRLKPDLITIT
jgi:GDP-4-dehydro-6-deoxy-D-mannose reductase